MVNPEGALKLDPRKAVITSGTFMIILPYVTRIKTFVKNKRATLRIPKTIKRGPKLRGKDKGKNTATIVRRIYK